MLIGDILTEMAGSPTYMAPEVLDESYGLPCDLWSVGVMLYTLLAGYPPFEDPSVLRLFDMIKSKPLDLQSNPWPKVSHAAKDLLCKLLHRDVALRATAQEALGECVAFFAYTPLSSYFFRTAVFPSIERLNKVHLFHALQSILG